MRSEDWADSRAVKVKDEEGWTEKEELLDSEKVKI